MPKFDATFPEKGKHHPVYAYARLIGLLRSLRLHFGLSVKPELYYVVPNANWSIDWDGHYITSGISRQLGWGTQMAYRKALSTLVGHVVHFGSVWEFLACLDNPSLRNNIPVATVFHGDKNPETPQLSEAMNRVVDQAHLLGRVVTASRIMEERLISWGIPREKIARIPLGVDLSCFRPAAHDLRNKQRGEYGIPEDAFCIGSFHKDGNGWDDEGGPKLIKGPDIFLEVVERLSKKYKLFIVLSAPARGYVKRGLEKLGIPYKHQVFHDYREVVNLYHCADACLMTSREEGGPKSVLESLACGVPFVGTRVGMAPDVIQHGENGLIADVDDISTLADQMAEIIETPVKSKRLVANGLETVKSFDWQIISRQYYFEIYKPLLDICNK